ncbi:MAG: peptidoglycan editing factor PgeF [Nitrospira sp.]|nr:peptidoglycan editing factor PgeF [Nitrospira sp.]MDH4303654.1 peptidoglycan editing factor PgeF [Nitrospira sp.]MDH5193053.1 peptidoglycan editing factor PgeF [Nitrospira sp.]
MARASVITVPAFADSRRSAYHFFGTRQHTIEHDLGIGIPSRGLQGAAPSAWTLSVKQVHGTEVLVVDRALSEADRFTEGWDALVTNQPGVMVAVRTADCVPILMHDPTHGVVAAIHAGWRGAVGGIVPKTLALLESRFGSDLKQVRLSIGPSAGVCCYEVDEPVLERLRQGVPSWEKVVRSQGERTAKLDLKGLIKEQALACGAMPQAITTVNLCTICHEDLFFSYRREGRVNGTMISAIGLPPTRR